MPGNSREFVEVELMPNCRIMRTRIIYRGAGMVAYFIGLALVAMTCIIIGLLIWKKQKINLIHDYHLKGIKDISGYSASMGKSIFALGIFLLFNGVMSLLSFIPVGIIVGILIVGMIIISAFIFKVQMKYSGQIM